MRRLIGASLAIVLISQSCDVLHDLSKTIETNAPLTEQEVVRGLKEALRVGTDTAVANVSALNGYYKDPVIRIALPPEANAIVQHKNHPLLQATGITGLIDDAEISLNRAAEDAAKSAKPIFVNALTSMSIQDAFAILNGSDTAATQFFRKKTYSQLEASFKPKIRSSLSKPLAGNVSANDAWESLTGAYNSVAPIAGWKKINNQLDEYVTRKALNGLFLKVAAEEQLIRKDPAARVTEILDRVFGNP
jgi:hypothetical protein